MKFFEKHLNIRQCEQVGRQGRGQGGQAQDVACGARLPTDALPSTPLQIWQLFNFYSNAERPRMLENDYELRFRCTRTGVPWPPPVQAQLHCRHGARVLNVDCV